MPDPGKYKDKDKDKFISDCMRTLDEENSPKDQKQRAGQCFGMWKGKNKKKKKEGTFDTVRKLAYKMKNQKG